MSTQFITLRPHQFPTSQIQTPEKDQHQRIFIPSHVYRHPSVVLLELYTSLKELHQILLLVIKIGFSDEHFFPDITEAARVFETVEHKLDVLYHTMLKEYAKNSALRNALKFYGRMRFDEVSPVVYDFTNFLQLCGDSLDLRKGREVHGMFRSNLIATTVVVNLYAKCRQVEDAYKMFERMPH